MNIAKLQLITVIQVVLLINNFSEEKIINDKAELGISQVKKEENNKSCLAFLQDYRVMRDNFIEQLKNRTDSYSCQYENLTKTEFEELVDGPGYNYFKGYMRRLEIPKNEFLEMAGKDERVRKQVIRSLLLNDIFGIIDNGYIAFYTVSNYLAEKISSDKIESSVSEVKKEKNSKNCLAFLEDYRIMRDNFIEQLKNRTDFNSSQYESLTKTEFEELVNGPGYNYFRGYMKRLEIGPYEFIEMAEKDKRVRKQVIRSLLLNDVYGTSLFMTSLVSLIKIA